MPDEHSTPYKKARYELTDVKAIEGVNCWRRTTVKCQNDTRVTMIGDAFLKMSFNHLYRMSDAVVVILPDSVPKGL